MVILSYLAVGLLKAGVLQVRARVSFTGLVPSKPPKIHMRSPWRAETWEDRLAGPLTEAVQVGKASEAEKSAKA